MKSYLASWRQAARWKTLAHIGLDLALLLLLVVLLSVNTLILAKISEPIQPVLQAIAQLEASGATDLDRMALLQEYNPDVKGLLVKAGIAAFLFYLLGVALYTLAKQRIWDSLAGRAFGYRRFLRLLGVTEAVFVVVALVPTLLALASPIAAVVAFFALAFLAFALLPAFYAIDDWNLFKLAWWWPLAYLGLVAAAAALWGLLVALLNATSPWAMAATYLLIAAWTVGVWALARYKPLFKYLLALTLVAATWLVAMQLVGLVALLSDWLYVALFAVWSLVWLAWSRHYLFATLSAQFGTGPVAVPINSEKPTKPVTKTAKRRSTKR